MADNVQSMGFDFSKDFSEFDKIVAYLGKYNLKLQEITEKSLEYNKVGSAQAAVYKAISEAGQKVTLSIEKTKDATVRGTVAIKEQTEELKKLASARLDAELAAQKKVRDLIQEGTDFYQKQAQNRVESERKAHRQIQDIIVQGEVSKVQAHSQSTREVAALNKKLNDDLIEKNNKVTSNTESTTKSMTLSWQSMVRLLEVQLIHNVFGAMLTQLSQGVREAEQLSIKIGEIQTISQDAQLTTEQWTKSIRELSDAYGRDLKDVAEGVYETLSNQISKGADSIQFMNSVLKFSIATVSSTADSVNLLTAAMNSYGYKQEQVDRIAASFFKTIDLGRVRANEMANTIGRVLPTAARLGVSLEEVEAAIATLTISGIKYNEAFTLIQNVLLKLLKPSEEMTKTFKNWGVASGEASLAAFGLGGTLKKLEEAAGGSDSELAAMFVNIRAIRGALGLTGAAFDTYQINLDKITKSTVEYNNAFQLVEQTPGKHLSDEVQRLKNVFVVDFGTQVVKELVTVTDAMGGLANAVKELTTAGKALVESYLIFRAGSFFLSGLKEAGSELSTLNILALNSTSSFGVLRGVLNSTFSPAGIIFTGLTAITYLYEKHQQYLVEQEHLEDNLRAAFSRSKQEFIESRNAILDKSGDINKSYTDHLFSTLLQQAAGTTRIINEMLDSQKERLKDNNDQIKSSLEVYVKSKEDAIDKIRSSQHKLETEIDNSNKRIEESKDKAAKSQLEILLSQAENSPLGQVNILISRFGELKKQISEAYAAGNADLAFRRYNEANEIVGKLAELQTRLTKESKTDTKTLDTHALDEQIQNIQNQIRSTKVNRPALERQLNDLKAQKTAGNLANTIGSATADLKQAQQALVTIQQTLGTNIVGTLAQFIQKQEEQFVAGAKKSMSDLTSTAEQNELRLALLRKAITGITDFSLFDKSGKLKYKTVQDAQTDLDRLIHQAEQNGLDQSTDQYKQVWELRKQIAIEAQYEILGAQSKQQQDALVLYKQQLESILQAAKKNQEDIIQTQANAQERFAKANGAAAGGLNFNASPSPLSVRGTNFERIDGSTPFSELLKSFLDAQKEFQAGQSNGTSPERLQQLLVAAGSLAVQLDAKIQEYRKDVLNGKYADSEYSQIGASENLTVLTEEATGQGNKSIVDLVGDAAIAYKNFQQQLSKSNEAEKQVAAVSAQVFELTRQLAGLPEITKPAIEQMKVDFDAIKQKILEVNQAIKDTATQLNSIRGDNINWSTWFAPHFASGGAVGIDSISARLSPGEFVMNSNASRTFLPQLMSMNSMRPQHMQSGGNVTMGDINISSNLTGNATTDALALGRALKREIRRGTLSF